MSLTSYGTCQAVTKASCRSSVQEQTLAEVQAVTRPLPKFVANKAAAAVKRPLLNASAGQRPVVAKVAATVAAGSLPSVRVPARLLFAERTLE